MKDICSLLTDRIMASLSAPSVPALSAQTTPLPRLVVSASITEEAVPMGSIFEIEITLAASVLAEEADADKQVEELIRPAEAWLHDPDTPDRMTTKKIKVWGLQPVSSEVEANDGTLNHTLTARAWCAHI
jgi:hypothetical protein